MPCPKEASFFQRNRTISALMDLSRRSHRFGYREHGWTPVLPAPFHAYWVIQISSGAEQASQKSRWQETKLQRRVNGGTRFEVRWKEKKKGEKKGKRGGTGSCSSDIRSLIATWNRKRLLFKRTMEKREKKGKERTISINACGDIAKRRRDQTIENYRFAMIASNTWFKRFPLYARRATKSPVKYLLQPSRDQV